jgi:battenin
MDSKWISFRNILAFWIFGLANNYAYVIMLSAAEDIISKQEGTGQSGNSTESTCEADITSRHCIPKSTGWILLADVLPSLFVKLTFPFFMHRIPFGFRHFLVCALQTSCYFIVGYSTSFVMSLVGVAFAALGSGLGEICYLSLTAHYSKNTISAWSSGTGGAGLIGSLAYAGLTEPHLANLSPRNALLVMLIVPVVFAITYWFILVPSPSVHRMQLMQPNTWVVPSHTAKNTDVPYGRHSASTESKSAADNVWDENWNETFPEKPIDNSVEVRTLRFSEQLRLITPLLRYMIPLSAVYVAEYLINQGLNELIFFDCSHGFNLSRASQYRWYQVLYQFGVLISRSSVNVIRLPSIVMYLLPVIQFANAFLFFFDAVYFWIPHIWIIFVLILFEGLLGGASYVNTFDKIHKMVHPSVKEYSLSVASMADSFGIVIAGLTSIPLYNYVCQRKMGSFQHI